LGLAARAAGQDPDRPLNSEERAEMMRRAAQAEMERQEIVNLGDFQAIEDAITGRSRRFVAGPDGSDPAGTPEAADHADPAAQGEPAGTVGPTPRGRQ